MTHDAIPEAGYLVEVVVVLLAAIVSVSLFQRARLGSVLGYLAAGILIGPSGLSLVTGSETIQALAELGVVFLLFTVGLELPFERIRVLGLRMILLGGAQVGVTGLTIALAAALLGAPPASAAVIGGGLALSSTAIVLRLLSDRGELTTRFGRTVFAVLLVQDLVVGPFLVIVLALGQSEQPLSLALGISTLKMIVAVMAILGLGRVVLRHAVWPLARIEDPEIFAALTLFVVLGAGLLTKMAGLSMAFGAFLAGMLLAETRYRLQVAAEILPFRGLLLGLFFMSVGMGIDLSLAWRHWPALLALVAALLLGKGVLLAVLGRVFALPWSLALRLGVLLAQGGEFAFVLLGAGVASGLLDDRRAQLLVLVVAFTMIATPFLARLGRGVAQRVERASVIEAEDIAEAAEALSGHVVIAGFGRVGTAVANRLEATGVPYVALDLNAHRIAEARRRALPVFYGDASRPEVLAAVHVERARAVVVAVDDPRVALSIVALLAYIFPEMKVYARAKNDEHAAELQRAGAITAVPEMVQTGVSLADSILQDAETRGAP